MMYTPVVNFPRAGRYIYQRARITLLCAAGDAYVYCIVTEYRCPVPLSCRLKATLFVGILGVPVGTLRFYSREFTENTRPR